MVFCCFCHDLEFLNLLPGQDQKACIILPISWEEQMNSQHSQGQGCEIKLQLHQPEFELSLPIPLCHMHIQQCFIRQSLYPMRRLRLAFLSEVLIKLMNLLQFGGITQNIFIFNMFLSNIHGNFEYPLRVLSLMKWVSFSRILALYLHIYITQLLSCYSNGENNKFEHRQGGVQMH